MWGDGAYPTTSSRQTHTSFGVSNGMYGSPSTNSLCTSAAASTSSSSVPASSQRSKAASSAGTDAFDQFGNGLVLVDENPFSASTGSGHNHLEIELAGAASQAR